jgi:hypothetical protein
MCNITAVSESSSQETPYLSRNPLNPVSIASCLRQIHFSIILYYSLHFRCSDYNSASISHACYKSRPLHSLCFYHPNNKRRVKLCYSVHDQFIQANQLRNSTHYSWEHRKICGSAQLTSSTWNKHQTAGLVFSFADSHDNSVGLFSLIT